VFDENSSKLFGSGESSVMSKHGHETFWFNKLRRNGSLNVRLPKTISFMKLVTKSNERKCRCVDTTKSRIENEVNISSVHEWRNYNCGKRHLEENCQNLDCAITRANVSKCFIISCQQLLITVKVTNWLCDFNRRF
jgi:hypothetical protein